MNIDVDFTFPHQYQYEVLSELPGRITSRRYFFPGGRAGGHDGPTLRVIPDGADAWIGTFGFGGFGSGITRVLSMPNVEMLCVIVEGAGYVVDAYNPNVCEEVRAVPIVDARAIPVAGVVVFANYTELVAYGESGMKWRTKRLAWDGLKVIAIRDHTLVGEYWDLEDRMRPFEVHLLTGVARGGVEP